VTASLVYLFWIRFFCSSIAHRLCSQGSRGHQTYEYLKEAVTGNGKGNDKQHTQQHHIHRSLAKPLEYQHTKTVPPNELGKRCIADGLD